MISGHYNSWMVILKMTLTLQDEELGEISENISYLFGGFQTKTGEQVHLIDFEFF